MMGNKSKESLSHIVSVFTEVCSLLAPAIRCSDAVRALHTAGTSVYQSGQQLLLTPSVAPIQANIFTAAVKSFDRHLSEVEQTVYEELGGDTLDRILALLDQKTKAYNQLTDYALGQ
jgi:hypothetical protein